MVKVRFFTLLRLYLKTEGVDVETKQRADVINVLKKAEQEMGKRFIFKLVDENQGLKRGTIILVNGKNILHLQGLNTQIHNNDQIALFPPGAGG